MSINLTHYIDDIQVLSRAEILVQYSDYLTTATIQYFLETKKPRSWESAKNKYWYAKEDIDQLLVDTKKALLTDEPAKPFKVEISPEVWEKFRKSVGKKS